MSPSRPDAYGSTRPYGSGVRGRAGVPPRAAGPPHYGSGGPTRPIGPPALPHTGDYDYELDVPVAPHDPGPSLLEPPADLEPLPPARPRRNYHGRRRQENPWASYGLIVAVPLVLVLLIVGFSALPPYTPSGRAQQQPANAATNTGGNQTGPSATANGGGTTGGTGTVAVYEAEDTANNTLGPTTKLRAVPGASGGTVVSNVGMGTPNGDVKFNAVTAATAGKYTVTIYYLLADKVAHRLALWVNGVGPTILSFPPLGVANTNKIGTFKATVTLKAGTNTIRFSNATKKYGPDLDRITVAVQ
ncbi:MAG TPA: hypothetical protein VJT31_18875 [Rugosimonospora sp.]|nr:hypothetical protein [Rugosimonospora sp.]